MKSALEKRVDALEANSGGGGVGENVGLNNEIFSCYETTETDTRNKITASNTDYDYNTAIGSSNTIRNCKNSFVAGKGNEARFASSNFTVGQGNVNTSDNCIICGKENTGSKNSLVCGRENAGGGECNVVAGYGIYLGADNNCSVFCGIGHKLNSKSIVSAIFCGNRGTGNYNTRFAIGNGTTTTAKNAFDIDNAGNVRAAGTYGTMGADYAEMFEWLDGNPAGEDRRGMLVNLEGDKLIPAHGDEYIGIISSNPSVIGNSSDMYWHGMYNTDVFGRPEKDENGEPVLSESFDSKRLYIPRSQRSEWATVGLVGRLVVIDDGSCTVGSYISARNGAATKCFKNTGARVLKRIDDTHIEVLIR